MFLFTNIKKQTILELRKKFSYRKLEISLAESETKADVDFNLHKKLAKYYLSCLSRSERVQADFFAASKYAPSYAELSFNPFYSPVNYSLSMATKQLIDSSKKSKDKEIYVGHVIYVEYIESKRSDWKGHKLYPLLISPAEISSNSVNATSGQIFVNPDCLKRIMGLTSSMETQEAVLALEEDLGLGLPETNILDVLVKLRDEYSYWDWIESMESLEIEDEQTQLANKSDFNLKDVVNPGLYNRSVIFLGSRPQFTIGLEAELKLLSECESEFLKDSVLASWLGYEEGKSQEQSKISALLEPIPLNSEQRDAVTRAMTQPLTVITGPPGTGKSQVVSSILINSALRQQTVLFSSKNNKAVDVVETRVNSLGPSPILLRVGARNLQDRLFEYLTRLISLKTESEDKVNFAIAEQNFKAISDKIKNTVDEISKLQARRNEIDDFEKEFEIIRQYTNGDLLNFYNELSIERINDFILELETSLRKAYPKKMNFFYKLFYNLNKDTKIADLKLLLQKAHESLSAFSFNVNVESIDPNSIEAEIARCKKALEIAKEIPEYIEYMDLIHKCPNIGELSAQLKQYQEQISEKSIDLWHAWLRTLSDRLNAEDRRNLTKYQSIVAMLSQNSDSRSASNLKRQQQELFPYISKFLPCWAVTSLSVRNRIPYRSAFFDLVVIDEASQCDIASAIPLLLRAKRAVIIGDPLQLRHVSEIDVSTDRALMSDNNLVDHLEWSYSTQSLFDIAAAIRDEESMITLRDHHRSDSQIIEYSNKQFYDGKLRVATKHENLNRPTGQEAAVRWIDVKGKSIRPTQGSVICKEEAMAVVEEIERFANQGYRGSIGVVTPFAPQARLINDLIKQRDNLTAFSRDSDLLVATAHSFQGDERDLIIMSPALQSGTPESAIKFVSAQANLFNVAITRARASLIVVGNKGAKELNQFVHIKKFVDYVDSLSTKNENIEDSYVEDYGPTYPQDRKIGFVSDYEIKLYEELYREGIKTVPQLKVDQYQLDLALISGNRRLDIEVDGEMYHRHWSGEHIRRDILRSQRLIELGWDVQRFWVYQIQDDLQQVIRRVKKWIDRETTEVGSKRNV